MHRPAPLHPRRAAAVALACAATLPSCGITGARAGEPTGPGAAGDHPGATLDLRADPELDRILRLEDARDTGAGELQRHLAAGPRGRRARAADALGRMPLYAFGEDVTQPLCMALEDPAPEVRAAAAAGLGMRADPASTGVLLAYASDPDPGARAQVIDALSKLPPTAETVAAVLAATADPDRAVVVAAVVGTHRWPADTPGAEGVDTALLGVLRPFRAPIYGSGEPHPDVVWYTLFALSRRGSEKGRGAYLEFLHSRSAEARIFSARGLSRLPGDPDSTAALLRASGDADWRVAVEAVHGILAHGDPANAQALLPVAGHASHHVRAVVLSAASELASRSEGGEAGGVRAALVAGLDDRSATVRAEAIVGLAVLGDEEEAGAMLAQAAADMSFVVRAAAAGAASEHLSPQAAVEFLLPLVEDPDPSVRLEAVTALGSHPDGASRETLRELLRDEDLGLRLGAVLALSQSADADDVAALSAAATTARGEGTSEVCIEVLRTLGGIGGQSPRACITALLAHPDPHVRRVAREVHGEAYPGHTLPRVVAPRLPADEVPLPGRHYELYPRNPVLVLETSRGEMRFELFPAEAPVHVHNLIQLAERGRYDGLRFHRVVSDFVIQGGDHRGDGNGARPWRGAALRHEIGTRRYVRGSLGMPRYEDLESGGSQLFVTHRPTPHLDGRYTIFGELRDGGEVLDAVEVGDLILSAQVIR